MGRFKQYYGIKFPFTNNNDDGLFIDLNDRVEDKIASQILHVLMTPKGRRIRMPDFGTDLSKYIFDLDSDEEWELIKNEAIEAVSKYVPMASLSEIEVYQDDSTDEHAIYIDLHYEVSYGSSTTNNRMVVKL